MGEKELRPGGLGLILTPLVAILALLGPIVALEAWWSLQTIDTRVFFIIFSTVGIFTWTNFLILAILLLISTVKMTRRFKGNQAGTIGAVFGIFAAILYILYHGLPLLGIGMELQEIMGYWILLPNPVFESLNVFGSILLGLSMVLIGVFFLVYREYFSNNGIWLATGVTFIMGGVFSFTVLIASIGIILLFFAGAMGATSFLITEAVEA
ncbi:MAG: hypothetical protein ACFE7S_07225 [Candidatus Hodarchaeota archaeon]